MSTNNWPHVLNLSNSIIGVTVLAMPFCFKECGVVLGVVLLFFSTWLTLKSCQLLMKAGITSRRKSYGFLAYYTHGAPGKFAVEVGMIGLQIGTLIAQVVIIGDLGPAIISKVTGLPNSSHLRTALIVIMCSCVGFPLGLLKNLNTVSHASSLCIAFYTIFVFYVMLISTPNLLKGDWYNKVNIWRTEGLFKCLPIFSFAFGCQTQLFILYDALQEPSLKMMNSIVGSAVNMCTVAYLLVGFFGYVAFCDVDITGDIINHFDISMVSDILKIGFVISIAITFPLIIFPCRSSLYTMLFPQKPKHDEDIEQQRPVIPEIHFKVITAAIVIGAMITGILVPNVEFVLAMNGATMGTLICYMFPALFFLRVMTSSSDGKSLAQLVFIFGFTIMLLCTYTTLNSQDVGHIQPAADIMDKPVIDSGKNAILEPPKVADMKPVKDDGIKKKPPDKGGVMKDRKQHDTSIRQDRNDTRIEPPNPKEPIEPDKINKSDQKRIADKTLEDKTVSIKQESVKKLPTFNAKGKDIVDEKVKVKEESVDEKVKVGENNIDEKAKEKEKQAVDEKQKELIEQLEKQQKESKKLLEEQKQILEELKQHKEEVHKQEDRKQQQQVEQKAGVQGPQVQQLDQQGGQQVGQLGVNQGQQQPVVQQGQQVINQQLGQQVQAGQQKVNQVQQQAPVQEQIKQQANQQAAQGQQMVNQPAGQQQVQAVQPMPLQGQQQAAGQQQFGQQFVNQGQEHLGQQVVNQGQQQAAGLAGQQVFQQAGQQQQVQAGQQVANQGVAQQNILQGNIQQPAGQQNIGGNNPVVNQQAVGGLQADKQSIQGQAQEQNVINRQGQGQQPVNVNQVQDLNVGQGKLGSEQELNVAQGQSDNLGKVKGGQMEQPMNAGQGQLGNVVKNEVNFDQQNVDNVKNKPAYNDEQKLVNIVQQDLLKQNDKPLNRQKRDSVVFDSSQKEGKESVKNIDNIDTNNEKSMKNKKNEEMRRKKLSVDDNDVLLYEALRKIGKDVSKEPLINGAVRSLKSKQE